MNLKSELNSGGCRFNRVFEIADFCCTCQAPSTQFDTLLVKEKKDYGFQNSMYLPSHKYSSKAQIESNLALETTKTTSIRSICPIL